MLGSVELDERMLLTAHDDAATTGGLHDDTATAGRTLLDGAEALGGTGDAAVVGAVLHDDAAAAGGLHDDAATAGSYQ